MKLAINGSFTWWSLVSFEKALGGPQLEFFEGKHYGAGVNNFHIELGLQEDDRVRHDRSSYLPELTWVKFSIQVGPEIKAIEEAVAFRAIAEGMLRSLAAGLKRRRVPDFDHVAFLADLTAYVAEKINFPDLSAAPPRAKTTPRTPWA